MVSSMQSTNTFHPDFEGFDLFPPSLLFDDSSMGSPSSSSGDSPPRGDYPKRPLEEIYADTIPNLPPTRQRLGINKIIRQPQIRQKYILDEFGELTPLNRIIDDKVTKVSEVIISGIGYEVRLIGEGESHKVFEFLGEGPITFSYMNSQGIQSSVTLERSQIALRHIKDMRQDYMRQAHKKDKEANQHLITNGIPHPEVYLDFSEIDVRDTDVKTHAKYGDFTIIEKMKDSAEVHQEDPSLQAFVKHWLTQTAKKQKVMIHDFRARNIMRKNGEWRVVDPDLFNRSWEKVLWGDLLHWAENDVKKFNFYIEDFPEDIKKQMLDQWNQKENLSK